MIIGFLNKLKRNYSYLAVLGFAVLYILFLSNNPTSDSYSYAYSSLHGEELLRPHHLLYCVFSYLMYHIFSFLPIEPIHLFQLFNALISCGVLLILRRIVKRVNRDEKFIFSAIVFCGACFGFMRFATDNEAYILPLFFSMLSIYYMQNFLIENTSARLVKLSISICLACLFHQLSILVYLCVFMGLIFNKRLKYFLGFISISLIIPIVYSVACFLVTNQLSIDGLLGFVLHDYIQGYAQSPDIKQVLLLSIVNLARTFIQLHGNIIEIVKDYTILSVVCFALFLPLFAIGVVNLFKNTKNNISLFSNKRFIYMIWGVLVLSFLFAAFSNGNAEFMIIIPFVLIVLYTYYFSNYKTLLYIGFSLFLWNTTFALFPQKFIKLNCNEEIVALMKTYDKETFVLMDKPAAENLYMYKYGAKDLPLVISSHKYNKEDDLNEIIITDVIGAKTPLSRSSILNTSDLDFKEYKKDSLLLKFESLGVKRELHLLQLR